ncbi:MAG TPA: hypothetical protein DCP69_07875 [Candidatus Omnitrophica bacterium]|nr:hypothetical protein [Candidatus Omnitrophota bacterium]
MQNVVISIIEILDRIKLVTDAKNDADIARLLKVPPKKLAVWKLRNTIPYEQVISFCREFDLELEWILTGAKKAREQINYDDELRISARYIAGVKEPLILIDEPEAHIHPEMVSKIINELLATMTVQQKRDILRYAEERKLLAGLLAEKKDKKPKTEPATRRKKRE